MLANPMEILQSISHPSETWALLQYKYGGGEDAVLKKPATTSLSPDLKRCYELLGLTSRSFSAVIQALDDELRDAVCLFYLILRALDTIEDDMSIHINDKIDMLKSFHYKLYDPEWKYMNSKEKDKTVLEEFPKVKHSI
jgi:farnesyl-diphosphate farnesyltransferase